MHLKRFAELPFWNFQLIATRVTNAMGIAPPEINSPKIANTLNPYAAVMYEAFAFN